MRGPAPGDGLEDVTFTAEDVSRLRAAEVAEKGGSGQELPTGTRTILRAEAVPLPLVDPALTAQYDAIRQSASATEEGVWEVQNTFANVRAEPQARSALVARLNRGAKVRLLEFINGEWAKVRLLDKREGYVAHRYLARHTTSEKLAQERQAFANTYYVNYGYVNVRAEPNQRSLKLGRIPGQELLKPQAVEGEWAKVAFQGKTGYVAVSYLRRLELQFMVRTDAFRLPILRFSAADAASVERLRTGVRRLQLSGVRILTLRDLADALLADREPPSGAAVLVTGVRPETVKAVSRVLAGNGARATLFLRAEDIGISGITQKTLLTLRANGFDLQAALPRDQDLRALPTEDILRMLTLARTELEARLGQPVLAVLYPGGLANDRVAQAARSAGYLLGVGGGARSTFSRSELLQLPSFDVRSDTDDESLVKIAQ